MYELLRKGKLSATTSDIADYLAYTVKFAELLENHTLASAIMYDNEYRKLQCEYGFRWGSDSQHLHTRFLVKRRSSVSTTTPPNSQKISPRPNRQPKSSNINPICRQFNSFTGYQWPNCRFQHVCLVPSCNQGHPQHEHHTISPAWRSIILLAINSPLNKQAWIRNLGNDPDRKFIIDGITNGFEIIPSETVLEKAETSNYKSATASQFRNNKVENQIREEISKGNYVVTQAKPTIVSTLGAIPKPQTDKIRLIHDCSRPQHSNVNSYATTQHFSYVTVEQAVSMIKPNAYLAKIDLKNVYRHVPIHPSNYSATGLAWQFHG